MLDVSRVLLFFEKGIKKINFLKFTESRLAFVKPTDSSTKYIINKYKL